MFRPIYIKAFDEILGNLFPGVFVEKCRYFNMFYVQIISFVTNAFELRI